MEPVRSSRCTRGMSVTPVHRDHRRLLGRPQRNVVRGASLALAAALVAGSCSASAAEQRVDAAEAAPSEPGATALVLTEAGMAGVPVGSSTPVWVVPGAVAAPDGSAVFVARAVPAADGGGHEVVSVDPATGALSDQGVRVDDADGGVEVAAVAPGGDRVVAVVAGGGSTVLLDLDVTARSVRRAVRFEGSLEPEAYSTDGDVVYAARMFEEHYNVHGLDLRTGEQWPTLGRDKSKPPEDMVGGVVHAALSPDGRGLATLYRDDVSSGHTAFVHLLSLETGTTVCIDLHEPFGTGERWMDVIEWRSPTEVVVGHAGGDPDVSMSATFDPVAIWEGEILEHYDAEVRTDAEAPRAPAGVSDVPGFVRFVAIAP